MAVAALRRRSICRAAQQSWTLLSTISSTPYLSFSQCRHELVEERKAAECMPNKFPWVFWNGGCRGMSAGIRSRVEKRMRRETGKTLREIRRAKKLRKKLMTEEERLIFSLRRAKKKVALLLQKLKKYELPELPPPRHDPELLTPEQLQALKKIGYKNQNYVPVGVRGVFGGVVQNMHMHWKFHETVQVCCDNFPKEKIREMATMLARLSGGIVINIHNIKTIIMYRGRNYRQPKVLIPLNTLTKRKALFKARFEQALESQKINIKKIEQQLRRMGVNPEDPIAMASVEKVASTFFRAIDEKQGSPYMLHGDRQPLEEIELHETQPPVEDSDQEELDRFIAEIEEAADEEFAAEEAAEKEERDKIRYWSRPTGSDETDGEYIPRRSIRDSRNMDSEEDFRGNTGWRDTDNRERRDPMDMYVPKDMQDRRSGNGIVVDGRRRQTMVDNWDSDDEGIVNEINMDDDWDADDDVSDKIRMQRGETDYEFDSEEEIDFVNNTDKGRLRSDQNNNIDKAIRNQMHLSERSRSNEDMDDDWDSDFEDWNNHDEAIDGGRKELSSRNDDKYIGERRSEKSREYKSDMHDHWASDEDLEYNSETDELDMHGEVESDEDVGIGSRFDIHGEREVNRKDEVLDTNKRKKQIDENWDSD